MHNIYRKITIETRENHFLLVLSSMFSSSRFKYFIAVSFIPQSVEVEPLGTKVTLY
jgi:hypothetical protein